MQSIFLQTKQVVDMRWGVRQEASVDHSASELCMREIKNCNEVSLGPTFVVSIFCLLIYNILKDIL